MEDDRENQVANEQGDDAGGNGAEQKGIVIELLADSQNDISQMNSLESSYQDDVLKRETNLSKSEWRYKKWLGITNPKLLSDHEKLEEYIIVKSIFDLNLSKL